MQSSPLRSPMLSRVTAPRRAASPSGLAYSGPYTEAVLVGNFGVRLQKPIQWDSAAMKATNTPEADPLIRKAYRDKFGI